MPPKRKSLKTISACTKKRSMLRQPTSQQQPTSLQPTSPQQPVSPQPQQPVSPQPQQPLSQQPLSQQPLSQQPQSFNSANSRGFNLRNSPPTGQNWTTLPPPPPLLNTTTSATPSTPTSNPDPVLPIPENPRSIRRKEPQFHPDGRPNRQRGLVVGTKSKNLFNTLGHKIPLDYVHLHGGPSNKKIRSLLVHDIGSIVKEEVKMLKPSYGELDDSDLDVVYDKLSPIYDLDPRDDSPLWGFVSRISRERYKSWKHKCQNHWIAYGDEVPLEFIDRTDQWWWLLNHFKSEEQQAKCELLKKARNSSERMLHCSGKMPFSFRAEEHARNGNQAPRVEAFAQVYAKDPIGGPLAKKMKDRVKEVLDSQDPDGLLKEALPVEDELEVIVEIVGEKRGTELRGIGKSLQRPPRPRGGLRFAAETARLEEEIKAANEKAAQATAQGKEQEARIQVLEDLVRSLIAARGSSGGGSEAAST